MKTSLKGRPMKIILKTGVPIMCAAGLLWGCQRAQSNTIVPKPSYALIAEDSTQYNFPRDAAGKIVVVGFIYTHCSGVCGMISNTMAQVQRSLNEEKGDGEVQLLSITFDPDRDTPAVLRQYAEAYTIRTPQQQHLTPQKSSQWKFLTASQQTTDSLMKKFEIVTRKTFTVFDSSNNPKYFLDHTDRILILNTDGTVWKEYEGSEVSTETLLADIGALRTKNNEQTKQ